MVWKSFSPLVALGVLAGLAPNVSAAAPSMADKPVPHVIGWVCMRVSDMGVAQISSFNRDAARLSAWVTRERFHRDPDPEGAGGRICVPAIVAMGTEDVPDNTLIFEREIREGEVKRPAVAEVVVTPEAANLVEVTVRIVGLSEQWTKRDGVWTFDSVQPVVFPQRVPRGLLGEGDGPDPADVFRAATTTQRFAEPCRPMKLLMDTPANMGHFDAAHQRVSARGVEPFHIAKGTVVSMCEGLSADGTMSAVATKLAGDEIGWYLIPPEAQLQTMPTDARFATTHPLGGYHVCRRPTWTTSLLEEVSLAGQWELLPSGEWRHLLGEHRVKDVVAAGTPATLLEHRDGWALVRVMIGGAPRVLAVAGKLVELPTGPGPEAQSLMGGLCQWRDGEWRATISGTQAFRVAQETPGAELDGLWMEIPQGTRVLALCQGKGCDPIYVGGSQSSETDRIVLVRYAGHLLGVRENQLRQKVSAEFATRVDRPRYWPADDDVIKPVARDWAFGLHMGARLSFVRTDDHAWIGGVRLQDVGAGAGFDGKLSVGGDGFGTFMSLAGGVMWMLHRFEEAPIEFRAGVGGALTFHVTDPGGMTADIIGKAQLRWVNDYAPVSLDIGLNFGFGGSFGDDGDSKGTFGMPISLNVELVQF